MVRKIPATTSGSASVPPAVGNVVGEVIGLSCRATGRSVGNVRRPEVIGEGPGLQTIPDVDEEPDGLAAVHGTVVECQGEIHERADLDGLVAAGTPDDQGFPAHAWKSEEAGLRG